MRRNRIGRVVASGVVGLVAMGFAGAQPAQADDVWQQPTPASFWSSAAEAATSTVYAPSSAALKRARAGNFQDGISALVMYCKGQWSVRAVYDDYVLLFEQGTDNGKGQSPCLGDLPGAGPDKTGTKVNVAGGRVDVYFLGCKAGVSDTQQDGLPEATCPAAEAQYWAFGRLPAAGGKKATVIYMQSLGLTRQQLTRVVGSLHAVS